MHSNVAPFHVINKLSMKSCGFHQRIVKLQRVYAVSCPRFVYQPNHFALEFRRPAHLIIFINPIRPLLACHAPVGQCNGRPRMGKLPRWTLCNRKLYGLLSRRRGWRSCCSLCGKRRARNHNRVYAAIPTKMIPYSLQRKANRHHCAAAYNLGRHIKSVAYAVYGEYVTADCNVHFNIFARDDCCICCSIPSYTIAQRFKYTTYRYKGSAVYNNGWLPLKVYTYSFNGNENFSIGIGRRHNQPRHHYKPQNKAYNLPCCCVALFHDFILLLKKMQNYLIRM